MLCVAGTLVARAGTDNGTRILWQIGHPGQGNSRFALAPDRWREYRQDGFFVVGRSEEGTCWPYVHPGPKDQWAGSRQHTFTIIFGTRSQADTGRCYLKFDLVDTHSEVPPHLRVQVNGHDFDQTLPKGAGDESLNGEPEKGKRYEFEFEFPTGLLVSGDNEIDITTISGSWFLYNSIGLVTPGDIRLMEVAARTSVVSVRALPFVFEKNGKFFQTIQLSLKHTGDSAVVAVRVSGTDSSLTPIKAGVASTEIPVPAVVNDSVVHVGIWEGGTMVADTNIAVKPVRKMIIYVLPHSHTDIGYTEIQTAVEQKQVDNLLKGIEYARRTADYPEGARFVWNVEVLWAADLYQRRLSEEQRSEFLDAVSKGWVGLNGMYLNELTGLCRPEELLRLFRFSTQLAGQCNTTIDAAMISDVPGYTWGTVTAMAQAGIRYFSTAPNYFDRIGDIMVQLENKPFYWTSPSGKESVLVWIPLKGYAMSHIIGSLSSQFVADYQGQLQKDGYPYDIAYIRWSGHGDNAVPDSAICGFIKEWNTKYTWPKFIISSTSAAFRAFEQRYGDRIPRLRGDWTPYWEDGAGSSALETAMNRASADRLTQAEALWTMQNPGGFPVADFEDAWRHVLLYSEHTWGAWCSVSDPENKATKEQWEIKRSYALEVDSMSRELLVGALRRAGAGKPTRAVDVFNTASWQRTDLVLLSKDLSAAGDRVTDDKGRPVPSQRLTTGELAFVASDVPAFSKRRYTVSAGKTLSAGKASAHDNVLANDIVRVRVDKKTGGVTDLSINGIQCNFADTASSYAINDYLFLPGDSIVNLRRNGPVAITVKEPGPLVASFLIESGAPGCNKLTREVRLFAGFDYVELINTVDKKRTSVSDRPGSWEFAQKGGKESVNFAFPFNVEGGVMRLDLPLGTMQPEIDQMPSACKNWFTVGRWADVSNERQGITWVTLDAPLVQVGGITATLLGSQTNPSVWRKHVAPTQELFSWAMNNHWSTNYRAYQEGPVVFRYVLRPHLTFEPDAATRFATALSQPLIAAPASGKPTSRSRLLVEPEGVVVLAMKPSDDHKAIIVRLFGASGRTQKARLRWAAPAPKAIWLSNTSERPLEKIGSEVEVPAWDVVTLRASGFRR
jgi:hypothetical protein